MGIHIDYNNINVDAETNILQALRDITLLYKDVIVRNSHSSATIKYKKHHFDTLYIYFWDTSFGGEATLYDTVLSYKLQPGQSDGIAYDPDKMNGHIAIRESDLITDEVEKIYYIRYKGDKVIADWIPEINTLHIPFDLPHAPDNVTEILYDILKYIRDNYNFHRDTDTIIKQYMLDNLNSKIKEYSNRVSSLKNELTKAVRKHQNLIFQQQAISSINFNKIIEKIESFQSIKHVEVNNGKLYIHTNPIDLENYEFPYEIIISLDPYVSNPIRIFNLTLYDRKDIVHHPHIDEDGIPCWGNILADIVDLHQRFEFEGLVILIINFLQSYNPDDAYLPIDEWIDVIDGKYYVCSNCEERLYEDEVNYGSDELVYCDSCFSEHFFYCGDCESVVPIESSIYLRRYDVYVCENCINDYNTCDMCEDIVHYSESDYLEHYDKTFCNTCFKEYLIKCPNCKEYIFKEEESCPVCKCNLQEKEDE